MCKRELSKDDKRKMKTMVSYLSREFGGIRTIEYTQSLAVIIKK